MKNLLCDKDGVPLLVQSMTYYKYLRLFKVLFFNGMRTSFTCELVGPKHLPLDADDCTPEQLLEVENNITRLAKTEWEKWFPTEQIGV